MQATEGATRSAQFDQTAVDRQALIEFLRERDMACPLCQYNLRGLMSPRCPECGRDLELRVGLSEPRQGAWLTAQIALTAMAGIGMMIAIVVCFQGWPRGDPHQGVLNFAFVMHLLMVPASTLLLIFRRRYMRLAMRVQWTGAALAVAVGVTCMVMLAIASV
jgi:hypothetical protein